MRRGAAVALLAMAGTVLAAPLNQFPAESARLDDGTFLQAREDRKCGHLVVRYNAASANATSAGVGPEPMLFVDAGRTEVLDIGNRWTQSTVGLTEWEYDDPDDLSGVYACSVRANLRNSTLASAGVMLTIGRHAGGAVVTGDELVDLNGFSVATTATTVPAEVAWVITIDEGDRIAPMVGLAGIIFYNTARLECAQRSVKSLGLECWE